MLNSAGQLAAAQLALYLVLVIFAAHSLYKHGRPGVLGWVFLFAFCSLRIVGSGLQISNEKHETTNRTSQIIGGVGLSPLVLSIAGVLHEANFYLPPPTRFVFGWVPTIGLHAQVLAGMALIIVGFQPDQKHGKTLQTVGYVLFLIAWLFMLALTVLSWKAHRRGIRSNQLLTMTALTLPILLIRILYSLISVFDTHINSSTGAIVYRICLSVLMELLIVIILSAAGEWTMEIGVEARHKGAGGVDIDIEGQSGSRREESPTIIGRGV